MGYLRLLLTSTITLFAAQVAGNIIPALATTTSVVAGLVAQEVVKVAAERVRYCREQSTKRRRKAATGRGCFPSLTRLGRRVLRRFRSSGPKKDAINREDGSQISRSYLLSHKERLLSTFRNAFVNLATPMVAFAQPQEADRGELDGKQYSLWDSLQVGCSWSDLGESDGHAV